METLPVTGEVSKLLSSPLNRYLLGGLFALAAVFEAGLFLLGLDDFSALVLALGLVNGALTLSLFSPSEVTKARKHALIRFALLTVVVTAAMYVIVGVMYVELGIMTVASANLIRLILRFIQERLAKPHAA